jgi:hypothetical protein
MFFVFCSWGSSLRKKNLFFGLTGICLVLHVKLLQRDCGKIVLCSKPHGSQHRFAARRLYNVVKIPMTNMFPTRRSLYSLDYYMYSS